jgi:hypothetical protein
MAKNLQGALHPLGARAYARNSFVQGICAQGATVGEKPARLLKNAFIEIGQLPNH